MTRKLIIEEWLSLDGHVSDKMGKLDFFVHHVRDSYTTGHRMDLLNSIDTILLGRSTYAAFSALWPDRPIENDLLAEKINTLPKIVFSNTHAQAPWGQWPAAMVASGNPVKKMQELKAQPGKDMVLWGSIQLAQTFIEHNLVDEYHLHLCPVLTGGGRKLFPNDFHPAALSLIDTKPLGQGVVFLKYGRSTAS